MNCCNTCYEKDDCVAYRYSNTTGGNICEQWTTSGGTSLDIVNTTDSCPSGTVDGSRQQISDSSCDSDSPIAIGPCLNAAYEISM